MTAGNPKYLDQFHEARYNLALCRYMWALAERDENTKKQLLRYGKQDIAQTVGLYGDLGGPKWEAQYDSLMKKIQKSLLENPEGINYLKTKPVPVNVKEPAKVAPVAPKTTTTSSTVPAVVKPAAAVKSLQTTSSK